MSTYTVQERLDQADAEVQRHADEIARLSLRNLELNFNHVRALKRVERLSKALLDYGGHAGRCDHRLQDPYGCSCGWKDLRSELRTALEPVRAAT